MELHSVPVAVPPECNVIIGQAHFIKTAEDIGEILSAALPSAQWAVAFNEASPPCLVRSEANDEELRRSTIEIGRALGAGHLFVILIRGGYPIQVLDRIKASPEVCTVFCATANRLTMIVAQEGTARGVLGAIDGETPAGVEQEADRTFRRELLRRLRYKF